MKSRILLIFAAFATLCLSSCTGGFREVRVTSCEVKSLNPVGLAKMEATVEVGVHNPAREFHLKDLEGVAKYKGQPCLTLTTPDITVEGRTDKVYSVTVTGSIDRDFNLLQIIAIARDIPKSDDITVDIHARASLGTGAGRKIVMNDIPLKDLIERF